MGNLYDIINGWRDSQRVPATWRQIALHIGRSQSTIKGWERGLRELPARGSLWAVHDLTTVPYHRVVQAAIDDAELFSVERGHEDYVQRQAKKDTKPAKASKGEKTARPQGRVAKKSISGTPREERDPSRNR